MESLEVNQRLSFSGKKIQKYNVINPVLKDHNQFVINWLVNKITIFVVKLFQAIERFFKSETTAKEVTAFSDYMSSAILQLEGYKEQLNQGEIQPKTQIYYDKFKNLKRAQISVQKIYTTSLPAFRITCSKGETDFFRDSQSVRDGYLQAIDLLSVKIQRELAPLLSEVCEMMEQKIFVRDKKKVKAVLEAILKDHCKTTVVSTLDTDVPVCTRAVKKVLSEWAGSSAVDRSIAKYGFEKKECLTPSQVKMIVVGIVAGVKKEDLNSFKDGRSCESSIDDQDKQLDPQVVTEMLIKLRKINFGDIVVKPKTREEIQLNFDLKLLQTFNRYEEYTTRCDKTFYIRDVKRYADSEYLSRYIVYRLFEDLRAKFEEGVLFPIHDNKGEVSVQEAHTLVSFEGLHSIVVKPLFLRKETKKEKMYVVFRGTYCRFSLSRCLSFKEKELSFEFEGPGRASFRIHEQAVLDGIMKHLESFHSQVIIEFSGHSLGATDASRACESFTNIFSDIKGAEIGFAGFNTPGIEPDLSRRFLANVEKKKDLFFNLKYFDTHNDPIQQFGKVRLGYLHKKKERPENLYSSVFKFDRAMAEREEKMKQWFIPRLVYRFKRSFEAHTTPCLETGSSASNNNPNGTFIKLIESSDPNHGRYRTIRAVGESLVRIESQKDVKTALRTRFK